MLKREGTAAPLGLVLALANKPNCPSEASHVMKTSSEMNYMSVNPLINIMDSSLSPLRSNKLKVRETGIEVFLCTGRHKGRKSRGKLASAAAAAAIHCSHGRHLVQHLFFMYFIIKTCEFCKPSMLHADQR